MATKNKKGQVEKSENEIRKEWLDLRDKSFSEIEYVLRKYDFNAQDMLASFVASICGIDLAEMLSSSEKLHLAQSRWLYWYALRYMTHDTYERISERTMLGGCRFSPRAVGFGITKMGRMIDSEDVWKGRWMVIKRMIKLSQDPMSYYENDFSNPMPEKYKLMLRVPKSIKDKVEVVIQEEQ